MHRVLRALVVATLISVLAGPAAALTFRPSASYSAWVNYQSDATLIGPGVHTRMWVRYSETKEGQGIQISGFGWDNGPNDLGMLTDWAWAYEKTYPSSPDVGGVSRSLDEAWAGSDALVFQCWTPGKCPALPPQIVVKAQWTAIGPATADESRDTMGDPTTIVVHRSRPATVTLELSYPAGGGPLPIPALEMSNTISWDHFADVRK